MLAVDAIFSVSLSPLGDAQEKKEKLESQQLGIGLGYGLLQPSLLFVSQHGLRWAGVSIVILGYARPYYGLNFTVFFSLSTSFILK